MSALERENFDLKMRLFYKEKESLKDTSTLENEAERVVGLLQERDDTYDQLRRANEEAYNTISELRAELQLVKASKEGSNSAYESLLHKNQRLASLQLEENLKRERQAAQAIAAHDASLIAKLEDDLEALQATHEADNKLVSECSGRVAELMGIIEEKNATIEKQTSALDAANEHIEVLKDRVSRQEIFLIRGEQQDLLPKQDENSSSTAVLENGDLSDDPNTNGASNSLPRRNLSSSSLHSQHTQHSQHIHHSQHLHHGSTMSNNFSRNSSFNFNNPSRRSTSPAHGFGAPAMESYDEDDAVGSSMSLRPAPRLGQPFMSRGPEPSNGSNFANSTYRTTSSHPQNNHLGHNNRSSEPNFHHFSLSDLSSTVGPNSHTPLQKAMPTPHHFPRSPNATSTFGSPPPFTSATPSFPNLSSNDIDLQGLAEEPKPSGYLSDEAKKLINAEIEIDVLKQENASLKQTVEDEKKAFRKLEETLARVRSSSEEITLLEAEEIARLEVEMERVTEERDKYMVSSRSFETQNELLRQRLRDSNGGSDRSGKSQNGHGESPFSSPRNGTMNMFVSRQYRSFLTY